MVDLAAFSTDALLDLASEIDTTLVLIDKAGSTPKEREIERRMAERITSAFTATARVAIPSALKRLVAGKYTPTRIDAFLESLGMKMATPLTPAQTKIIEGQIKHIYRIVQTATQKEVKAKLVFRAPDQRAVKAIARTQKMWIGDFYSAQLSDRIKGVADDVLIKQGLGHGEAAKELGRVLRRELGVIPGGTTGIASQIPARYAGNPEFYFRQLASVSAQQARTFGRIKAFDRVDVISYTVTNPEDERTGSICLEMAGQIFSVGTAVAHIERFEAAETIEEVKAVQPWLSGKERTEFLDALGKVPKGSEDARRILVENGAILPSYHPLCRSDVVIQQR